MKEAIISRPEELAACCAVLAAAPAMGFDTEFVGEDVYHPRLCLVQVATADHLFLIDPLTVGPLDPFWPLLVDPAREVVVHAGREDVRLCRRWAGHPPGNLVDLQLAAGLVGMTYPIGHGNLVSQVLGVQLAKGETLTEWRDRPLTPEQIRYAFDDVRYLLAVWQKLTARLEALGRMEWAREEFARLARNAAPDDPVAERWRKLRGLGSLDRRRLAIVRALFAWREERAERSNRPARTIVRDDLMVEIARRNPSRHRDLQVVRGLARRDIDDILRVVEEARVLPLAECPPQAERDQDPAPVQLATSLLVTVLGDWCARREVAVGLAASTGDVRQLVRARYAGQPLPEDCPLLAGWRAEHLLPDLLAVLDGRRGVRIARLRGTSPFSYDEVAGNLPSHPQSLSRKGRGEKDPDSEPVPTKASGEHEESQALSPDGRGEEAAPATSS
jgi:ribonuclease D